MPKLLWFKTQEMLTLQGIKSVAGLFRYQRKFGHLSSVDMLFDSIINNNNNLYSVMVLKFGVIHMSIKSKKYK